MLSYLEEESFDIGRGNGGKKLCLSSENLRALLRSRVVFVQKKAETKVSAFLLLVVELFLDSFITRLFCTDTDSALDREDEDFAIADLAGLGGLHNGCNSTLDSFVRKNNFEFDFRQEVDCVLAATVDLGMALLAAKAFDFSYCHSFDSQLAEGILDLFKFEGFDDCFDFFHVC